MNSPIVYFGGKGQLKRHIIPQIAKIPHVTYVEVFGGGASVLFGKPPSAIEVYNDLDSALFDFFTVLATPALFERFYRRVALLPHSRQFYTHYRATWCQQMDVVERVARWFLVGRQAFSGSFDEGWSFSIDTVAGGRGKVTSAWLNSIDKLPATHERLQNVQVEHNDFRAILKTYDTPNTLFYLDPPYVFQTRQKQGKDHGYNHEMTDADHADMITRLLSLQGSAIVSGYAHAIYEPLVAHGWQRVDIATTSSASNRKGDGSGKRLHSRTETLWISPHAGERQLTLF